MGIKSSNLYRLKSGKDIAYLFEGGKNLVKYPFRLLYIKTSSDTKGIRFSIIVPKKRVKKAVLRNRIKRLVFESFRRLDINLIGGSYNFIILYIGKDSDMEYSYVSDKMRKLLEKFM